MTAAYNQSMSTVINVSVDKSCKVTVSRGYITLNDEIESNQVEMDDIKHVSVLELANGGNFSWIVDLPQTNDDILCEDIIMTISHGNKIKNLHLTYNDENNMWFIS